MNKKLFTIDMKYLSFLILFALSVAAFQSCGTDKEGWYEPKQGRASKEDSRFYNQKYATFPIGAGDILVYNAKNDSVSFDVIVTIKRFDSAVSLSYEIPDLRQNGVIDVSIDSVKKGTTYDTLSIKDRDIIHNKNIFWLSKKNFDELDSYKSTKMDLGNGMQTFGRGDTGPVKMKIKGKEKLLTVFNVAGKGEGGGAFTVLTDYDNPLILTLQSDLTYTLKEVR